MKCLKLNTDVFAIKCVKNYVFIGIGCTLYVLNSTDFKIKIKLDTLHPDNIHGIIFKPNNKLIVYGGKSICIFQLTIDNDFVKLEKLQDVIRFNDWIINVEWLEPLNNTRLNILFAHNNVYNYDFLKKEFTNTACRETCLLYAGSISGSNCKSAVIFSGTVFQEILIWKSQTKSNAEYSEVLHRLKGHKGVIFSVFFDCVNNLICSTSDDRTVRLWKIHGESISNQKNIVWETVEISLQTTMFGHLARVWRAVMLKDIIATIGEDSRICFWNLSGKLLHKIEAHQGAPIWCIGMSDDDVIYTGGADGSVNSWPLNSIKNFIQEYKILEKDKENIPKHVFFDDGSDILVYSNFKSDNQMLHLDSNDYHLKNLYSLPNYSSSYCIMQLSFNRQQLAVASIIGDVTLYKKIDDKWSKITTMKITDSKIFSIQWLNMDKFLVCATEGTLLLIQFSNKDFKILSEYILPPSRERWVTSACMHNNLLICGDRMGSIYVYKLKNCRDPIQAFKKIHGRLGVQSCTIMNSLLITTGRDGTLRFYKFCEINSNEQTVEFLVTKNMPMDWVCQLLRNKNEYYILGFKEEDFVIYNLDLKRILLKIPCGGGHRSWDCMIHNEKINFLYIQKREVHVITAPLESLFIPPLMVGFHTKEIYCIKTLTVPSTDCNILITGGEDCTLNINYVNYSTSELEANLKPIDSLHGHLSSIRCISTFTYDSDKNFSKYLIFSGGGRAQLKVWEVTVKISEDLSQNNVFCKDLLSYMLHGPDKERNKIWIGKELMYNADPETRYMDISTIRNPQNENEIFVFIACSDGYLRTLNYHISSNEIELIDTLAYKNRCILKVYSFFHHGKLLLMTLATDGLLNFWNVLLTDNSITIQNVIVNENFGFELHQSGINSFDIKSLNDHDFILATGGDDNLLNLLIFQIIFNDNEVKIKINSLWKSECAHYAQITGIKLLGCNKLISVGADQKLVIHQYSSADLKIDCKFLNDKTICIPDVQGISFCKTNKSTDGEVFCIYGKGFQLLSL